MRSLERIERWLPFLAYQLIARHLPVSYYPGGRAAQAIRYQLCRRMFRVCGTGVNVERGADFIWGRTVSIGDRSGIGIDAFIRADLEIGRDVMMGPRVMIFGRDHNIASTDIPMYEQGSQPYRPVVIEDDVWIGGGAIILAGVRIGTGSVVGAGAVVTKDVAPFTIVGGNPARVIRRRGERGQVNVGAIGGDDS
jgi:maltose O-acetyltransferase